MSQLENKSEHISIDDLHADIEWMRIQKAKIENLIRRIEKEKKRC